MTYYSDDEDISGSGKNFFRKVFITSASKKMR